MMSHNNPTSAGKYTDSTGGVAGPSLRGGQGPEPIPHGQSRPPGEPLSPAEAIARMTVPEGFRVELVASEPDLVNPVAMTFDERGRIWVTESLEYPRKRGRAGARPRQGARGHATATARPTRFTVFAEGLNIPSGIAVGHGGVWVANSPDILFLRDTDGDGKADRREVVVTGFGRADTHELPNSLTWGPDGWLYGWNGVFNPSQGRPSRQDPRIHLRDLPDPSPDPRLRGLLRGDEQPLGHRLGPRRQRLRQRLRDRPPLAPDRDGLLPPPGGALPAVHLEDRVDRRSTGTSKRPTAASTSSTATPIRRPYRERLFMGNIHGNARQRRSARAQRLDLRRRTPSPTSSPPTTPGSCPSSQKTGPDGCLYVLDWYDRYHCYQDARRDPAGIDRLKGRLYRVRYKDTPRAPRFDLAAETDDQLIGRLASPNVFYRDLAQRLLAERNGPAANAALEALVLDDASGRKARMHALWARVGAGPLDSAFLGRLLDSPRPRLPRLGRPRSGEHAPWSIPVCSTGLLRLAGDRSPDVQLQVAIAARKLEGTRTIPLLLDVSDARGRRPVDPADRLAEPAPAARGAGA